jgi:chromosome segregation ATPase
VLLRSSRSIQLQEFAHVIAVPGAALLRVLALRPRRRGSHQRPTLLIDDGQTVHRFAPLPAPADPRGTIRADYAVPVGLLGPRSSYRLELSDAAVVDLPTPAESGPTPSAGQKASEAGWRPVELEGLAGGSEHATAEIQAESERLAARVDELETRLQREAQEAARKLSAAAAEVADADQRALSSAADGAAVAEAFAAEAAATQARTETLERRVGDLEESVDQHVQRIDALDQELADVTEARSQLEQQLTDAIQARSQLEQQLTDAIQARSQLEQQLTDAIQARSQLEQQLTDAAQARSRLEDDLSVAVAASKRLGEELERVRRELRLMTYERDEMVRQVAAHDSTAVKARERAKQAEDAHADVAAALRELENWPAQLERRLASATTELELAKEARQKAEHDVKRLADALAEAEAKVELAEGARADAEAAFVRLRAGTQPQSEQIEP